MNGGTAVFFYSQKHAIPGDDVITRCPLVPCGCCHPAQENKPSYSDGCNSHCCCCSRWTQSQTRTLNEDPPLPPAPTLLFFFSVSAAASTYIKGLPVISVSWSWTHSQNIKWLWAPSSLHRHSSIIYLSHHSTKVLQGFFSTKEMTAL